MREGLRRPGGGGSALPGVPPGGTVDGGLEEFIERRRCQGRDEPGGSAVSCHISRNVRGCGPPAVILGPDPRISPY